MLEHITKCGRRIAILNDTDELPAPSYSRPYAVPAQNRQAPRVSSIPGTPDLVRANSYDSQIAGDPISPLTPLYDAVAGPYQGKAAAFEYRPAYDDYYPDHSSMYADPKRRSSAFSDGRPAFYEDEYIIQDRTRGSSIATTTATTPTTSSGERPVKRFPCRYRESHGCDKTFTTSGHASRHSKIHTAEKAVRCTFQGCPKKFTRADNMKQHLETHTKEKIRSHGSRPSLSSIERRSSSTGKSLSRTKSAALAAAAAAAITPEMYSNGGYAESLGSPATESAWGDSDSAWDMKPLRHGLSRPSASRSASGLDALAMAANAMNQRGEFPPRGHSYGG